MKNVKRAFLIILDSVGCGELPDAEDYGDAGANTLRHVLETSPRSLSTLASMGLGNIIPITGLGPVDEPMAGFGRMVERSPGKDTTTGHWEIMGLVLDKAFPTYPEGFPPDVVKAFEDAVGLSVLGNKPASGTEIIEELGRRHMETGRPIVYTSADSVFQIAAHEEVVPVKKLYGWCKRARDILTGEHAVSRVIARPFVGKPGAFQRTHRRHDFSLPPVGPTLLDRFSESGVEVFGIGKIHDIFCGRGIDHTVHTESNGDGMAKLDEHADTVRKGFVFANLVDFDMKFGHRNNVQGYADALKEFDLWLKEFLGKLKVGDLLIITADHGCDPTHPGTDHTREHVPLLAYMPGGSAPSLGRRRSFTDVAATLAQAFGIEGTGEGESFFEELISG